MEIPLKASYSVLARMDLDPWQEVAATPVRPAHGNMAGGSETGLVAARCAPDHCFLEAGELRIPWPFV